MTKQELEKIIDGINDMKLGDSKFPEGFTSHCKDWKTPDDFLKKVFGDGFSLEGMVGGGGAPANHNPIVAVIDSKDDGKDVPGTISEVVVAVGINCGQIDTSGGIKLPYDDTGMRLKLKKVYERLSPYLTAYTPNGLSLSEKASRRQQIVLLATNFFPTLTERCWNDLEINCIEEMLLVYFAGFANPFFAVEELMKNLPDHVALHLVFHGANNGVPWLGKFMLGTASLASKRCSVVFCDNLADNRNPHNAVLIQANPYPSAMLLAASAKSAMRALSD